jgi:hypothetical protein
VCVSHWGSNSGLHKYTTTAPHPRMIFTVSSTRAISVRWFYMDIMSQVQYSVTEGQNQKKIKILKKNKILKKILGKKVKKEKDSRL